VKAAGADPAPAPRRARGLAARLRGVEAEEIAALHLRRLGFRVVARNVRTRVGELDIVAEGHGLVVVCEVKARNQGSYGTASECLTPAAVARVRRAALATLGDTLPVRFDLIAITYDARGRASLEHLPGAF